MNGIDLFAKNEKGLETLIQTIKLYSQNIRIEFGIEKCAKNEKQKKRKLLETKHHLRIKGDTSVWTPIASKRKR